MNLVEPPTLKPGDDLDGLLRAFFRSQMPQPWPMPRLPRFRTVPASPQPRSGRSLIRSRYALAASVALLLLGSLFLSSRFTQGVKPDDGLEGVPRISSRPVIERTNKGAKGKEQPSKNKAGLRAEEDPIELDSFDRTPIR
jgi:hypothetical protein